MVKVQREHIALLHMGMVLYADYIMLLFGGNLGGLYTSQYMYLINCYFVLAEDKVVKSVECCMSSSWNIH